MSAFITPILGVFHFRDPGVASAAIIVLAVFYFGALIRSHLDMRRGSH